jgi:hypothetical protein
MKIKNLFLIEMVISCILLQNCTVKKEGGLIEKTMFAGSYHPPSIRSYPSGAEIINGWINSLDEIKMRAHAWDIWESINTTAPNGLPIWENWFTGYELFDAPNPLELRDAVRDFENPNQFIHAAVKTKIPLSLAGRPTSFNRFSPSLAQFIYNKKYYSAAVLDSINNSFIKNNTPVVNREITTSKDSIDVHSFALKPVFQFIYGDRPTVVPYWAGISVQSVTNLTNPSPDTWKQCVIVDPTGKLKPGTTAVMSCNGEIPRAWPVVSIQDFYSIKITKAQADSFSQFAVTSGDDVGKNAKTDSGSVAGMVKEGNYALLVAMHVTGKEIVNWTWQTFWWSPDTKNPVFGADRPSSITTPWNNYNMRTAYYMVSPANQANGGEPNIQFNPYLETNLLGKVSGAPASKDSISWYGVFSNCMSCHRAAAWNSPTYIPNGYVNAADTLLFKNYTKTDFLWSIPSRAH